MAAEDVEEEEELEGEEEKGDEEGGEDIDVEGDGEGSATANGGGRDGDEGVRREGNACGSGESDELLLLLLSDRNCSGASRSGHRTGSESASHSSLNRVRTDRRAGRSS